MIHNSSRKVYSRKNGKTICLNVHGFCGVDSIDSSAEYMNAAKDLCVIESGTEIKSSHLICIDGGRQ